MPRKQRVQLPNLLRHVMSRGNGRMEIFLDDTDYRQFIQQLSEMVHAYDIECWNYCVMPNHYHATLRPRLPNISKALQHLNGNYAQWWNARHNRVGHVLQGRPKIQIVQDDAYALALTRYVALNPVRAGLVDRAEDWRWSSYPDLAGLRQAPSFLAVSCSLGLFGEAQDSTARSRFARFVCEGNVAADTDDQFRSKDSMVGDHAFKQRVNREFVDSRCRVESSEVAADALPGVGSPMTTAP